MASTDEVRAIPTAESKPAALASAPDAGDRWRRRLAVALAVVATLEAAAIFLLGARGDPRFPLILNLVTVGFFGMIVLFAVVGAFIVGRRPRTRVAWVMIAMGTLFGASVLLGAYSALYVTPQGQNIGPFAMELLVLGGLLFVPAIGVGTTSLLVLYPTDAPPGPRWRLAIWFAVLGALLWDINVLFRPGEIQNEALDHVPNPLGAPAELLPVFDLFVAASNVLILVALLLGVVSLVVRYRRGESVVRAQIRWIAVIAIGAFLSFIPASAQEGDAFLFGLGVTFIACLPIAIGIAITRYRLYDIDVIINRALVYGSLTAILAGVFAAGVGLAQKLFVAFTGESSDAAIVMVTLVIATLYAPLRKRIEAVIDKRFKYDTTRFGAYTDKVKSVLAVIDPERAAAKLASEAVAELGAVGVAVLDGSAAVVASSGTWPLPVGTESRSIVLAHTGPVRSILVGPDRRGREYRAEDLAALEAAGRLTAEAVARAGR